MVSKVVVSVSRKLAIRWGSWSWNWSYLQVQHMSLNSFPVVPAPAHSIPTHHCQHLLIVGMFAPHRPWPLPKPRPQTMPAIVLHPHPRNPRRLRITPRDVVRPLSNALPMATLKLPTIPPHPHERPHRIIKRKRPPRLLRAQRPERKRQSPLC